MSVARGRWPGIGRRGSRQMFPVFVSGGFLILELESSRVLKNVRRAVFGEGKHLLDDCGVAISGWGELRDLTAILRWRGLAYQISERTSFRFSCHGESSRGGKTRMFLKLREPLFSLIRLVEGGLH